MSEWAIDPARSSIGFSVRHMVISKVRGRFQRFRGSIVLDDADVTRSKVEARIEVASVETGDRERDEYLRTSEFLDPAHHPEIVFAGRRVERAGRGLILAGDLTIRGVTREVSLEVSETSRARDRLGFKARTTIDRKQFELRWNQLLETGGMMVGDKLEIAIEVEAIPRSTT